MPRRQRKVYDNDGTVVTAVESVSPVESVAVFTNEEPVENTAISISDILENTSAYMMPRFRFLNGAEKGKCLICGKQTSMNSRKLCGDCMEQNAQRLYEMAQEAIKNGEKEVMI